MKLYANEKKGSLEGESRAKSFKQFSSGPEAHKKKLRKMKKKKAQSRGWKVFNFLFTAVIFEQFFLIPKRNAFFFLVSFVQVLFFLTQQH
jgi:hypothetical protein